jgi:hypothetical protein
MKEGLGAKKYLVFIKLESVVDPVIVSPGSSIDSRPVS